MLPENCKLSEKRNNSDKKKLQQTCLTSYFLKFTKQNTQ